MAEDIEYIPKGEIKEIIKPDGTVLLIEGNPCHRCGKQINGDLVEEEFGNYHIECFTCKECGLDLTEVEYATRDNEVYCDVCEKNLYGPRCHYCKKLINEKAIEFLDRKYHPNHFHCIECKTVLNGKPFKEFEGEPYCSDCFTLKVDKNGKSKGDICFQCKQPIFGEFVIINGRKCHAEHYTCCMCKADFSDTNSIKFNGKFYCNSCYKKAASNICFECKQPIMGRSLIAGGKLYHQECFKCSVCGSILTEATFMEKDGKPYCEFHYYQLHGETCVKCGEKIKGDSGLKVYGKSYHKDCFVCSQCEKKLDDKCKNFEDKPICMTCFGKLPKAVRLQIEKEEKAKLKLEKERKKAAEKELKEKIKKEKEMEKQAQKKLKEAKKGK